MKRGFWKNVGGILFDLDGVFYVGNRLIPGARETLEFLAEKQIPYCFVTNTTTQSSRELQAKLTTLGIPCEREQLISAPRATASYLKTQGIKRCAFVINPSVMEDFSDFESVDDRPQAVVVGDIGRRWSYGLLDRIFQHLVSGATLIAMHRNKYWQKSGGLHIDIGAFIAGLEYVADTKAVITGKPTEAFFNAALQYLNEVREKVILVGDDIQSDIGGAQAVGIRAALVKTGKYRPELVTKAGIKPDWIIPSVAHLKEFLG